MALISNRLEEILANEGLRYQIIVDETLEMKENTVMSAKPAS